MKGSDIKKKEEEKKLRKALRIPLRLIENQAMSGNVNISQGVARIDAI